MLPESKTYYKIHQGIVKSIAYFKLFKWAASEEPILKLPCNKYPPVGASQSIISPMQ